jgi:hypothetical protein
MGADLRVRSLMLALLLALALASPAAAQFADTSDFKLTGEDSLVVSPAPRRWDAAVLEVGALNLVTWAFGHYILDGYWTQISLETMDINMRHGFEWDPNMFKNNFSSHPYHGNTYFNAARTNGMNFWESIPYAFTGSLTWEMFMESEFPSAGDVINTTVGGVALGETLYRLSEQLLDDRTSGSGRVFREIGATALNPVGGFNRLVRGDMFRTHGKTNHLRNPMAGYVALGTSGNIESSEGAPQEVNPAVELTLRYGDPFKLVSSRKPFDYFTFRMWVSKRPEQSNMTIIQQGVLVGRNYQGGRDGEIRHLLGLFQHYDYVNVDLFNYGGMTLAPGLVSYWPLGKSWHLTTGVHAGWLMLGGSNNEYFTNSQGRNYNYTTGAKAKLTFTLSSDKLGQLLTDAWYFWMTGIEGIPGNDYIAQVNAVYNHKIYRNLGLGLEGFLYDRKGRYTGYPDSNVTVKGLRLLLTYGFY